MGTEDVIERLGGSCEVHEPFEHTLIPTRGRDAHTAFRKLGGPIFTSNSVLFAKDETVKLRVCGV